MTEWERDDDYRRLGWIRGYERGILLGHVGTSLRTNDRVWRWEVHDEYAFDAPYGTSDSAEAAMQACDEAAVAWVLIALAKRAARWVDEVDAKLAREYRAASVWSQMWLRACKRGDIRALPKFSRSNRREHYAKMSLVRG